MEIYLSKMQLELHIFIEFFDTNAQKNEYKKLEKENPVMHVLLMDFCHQHLKCGQYFFRPPHKNNNQTKAKQIVTFCGDAGIYCMISDKQTKI